MIGTCFMIDTLGLYFRIRDLVNSVILIVCLLKFRVGGKSTVQDYVLAAEACVPIIGAVINEIKNGTYPSGCFLNVDVPVNVATHKVSCRLAS